MLFDVLGWAIFAFAVTFGAYCAYWLARTVRGSRSTAPRDRLVVLGMTLCCAGLAGLFWDVGALTHSERLRGFWLALMVIGVLVCVSPLVPRPFPRPAELGRRARLDVRRHWRRLVAGGLVFVAAVALEHVVGEHWWLGVVELGAVGGALSRPSTPAPPTISEGTGPFTVILHDEGRRTLDVRRALRHFLGGDYASILARVEQSPAIVCRDCDADAAQRMADKLHELGAHTEILPPAATA